MSEIMFMRMSLTAGTAFLMADMRFLTPVLPCFFFFFLQNNTEITGFGNPVMLLPQSYYSAQG